MRRRTIFGIMTAIVLMGSSCKDAILEGFDPLAAQNLKVAAMPQTGAIVKGEVTIAVPLDISLSATSQSAFEVEIKDNQDTIKTLIDNGTLTNTVALPIGSYLFQNVVNIPFGVKKATFNVNININTLEKNYGKKIAFAVKLNSPSKGNFVDELNKSYVVVLETTALLALEEIHYLSFNAGVDGKLFVPTDKNYSMSSGGVVIPVKVKLNGEQGGAAFTARLSLNPDTIGELVQAGQIPSSTLALTRKQYTLDTLVKFAANQREATFNITVPISLINSNLGRYLGISVNLQDATRNLIDPLKKNLIVLINTLDLAETDITNQGTLKVSNENGDGPDANEGSRKVIDGSVNTKYLTGGYNPELYIQLKFDSPQAVKAYTLTSADDADDRDPKSWKFQGSNDGITWTTLDTRTNERFNDRFQTKRYDFTNTGSYTYYRLQVTENWGSGDFQMAEFRLLKLP